MMGLCVCEQLAHQPVLLVHLKHSDAVWAKLTNSSKQKYNAPKFPHPDLYQHKNSFLTQPNKNSNYRHSEGKTIFVISLKKFNHDSE